MEFRHLRYFAAVAETLSFSRAAEKLGIAQPALSRQIRQLESELEVTLVDRSHTPIRLTDAGHVLQAHAEKLLIQADIAITATQEAARGHDGRLVIGNDWRLTLGSVPESVLAFRARYPRIEVELAELPLHEEIPALREGRIHLGFLPRRLLGARDDLDSMMVVESEWVVVLPDTHRLAAHKIVRLVEFRKETLLWVDSPTVKTYRQPIIQLCRLAGFAPQFGRSAATRESVLAMVAAGYGIVLAPQCALPAAPAAMVYVPTDAAPVEMCAVWRRDDPSVPLRHFLQVLRSTLGAEARD